MEKEFFSHQKTAQEITNHSQKEKEQKEKNEAFLNYCLPHLIEAQKALNSLDPAANYALSQNKEAGRDVVNHYRFYSAELTRNEETGPQGEFQERIAGKYNLCKTNSFTDSAYQQKFRQKILSETDDNLLESYLPRYLNLYYLNSDIENLSGSYYHEFSTSYSLCVDEWQLTDLIATYEEIIMQMGQVAQRELDEERKAKVLTVLDKKRQDIHNQAAEKIQALLKDKINFIKENQFITDINSARKIFEALYHLRTTQVLDKLTLDEQIYDNVSIFLQKDTEETLCQEIKNKLDVDITLAGITEYGFHEDDPKRSLTYRFKGENIRQKKPAILAIIDNVYQQQKPAEK